MNWLFGVHVLSFTLAALACFGSIRRARQIDHLDTRRGLTGLLLSTGIWASANLGYLVVPSVPLKRACYILGLVAGLSAVGAWLYFAAVYTGRPPRKLPYRRLVVGVLLGLVFLKLTNPLHHLYFTAELTSSPFPHLAIEHGAIHWIAIGLAYALSFVGFFMLLEHFQLSGTDTRPLTALVGLTALPIGFNIVGAVSPFLLAMTYEPIGVAAFALGVLFVYTDRFRTIHLAGEIDDPVIVLDQTDEIRDYNREARTLFPNLDGAIGDSLDATLSELSQEARSDTDRIQLGRNGETRYYRLVTNPFMAGETQTGRALVIADVTETEQYRQRLEQRTEQLEALNRVVRHDIRNDMDVILSWGDILKRDVDEEDEKTLKHVLRAADHTVELTKTAGDFVESLADEGQPELKPVALDERLQREVNTARETYPDAQFDVPETIPSVTVQANEMLSSVFRNLLNNAVQHNQGDTPEITVTVEEQADSAIVRIADDGPGIPDHQRDDIFGKGEKGLDSEGTGIGLYLVQTLVGQFDGSVSVENNEPKGIVFVIELPKTSPHERAGG